MVVYIQDDEDDPIGIAFTDDVTDIWDIIRAFGEEAIISIVEGKDLDDVTEETMERKPKSFLIPC